MVKFPLVNTSDGSVKLKKGEVIVKIDSVEKLLKKFLKLVVFVGRNK